MVDEIKTFEERKKELVAKGKEKGFITYEELAAALKGLDLDSVWENIIKQIGDIQVSQGKTLDEQIAIDDKKAKLEKEIARLEKQARNEKQPKKKFELVQCINSLKQELSSLI